MTTSSEQKQAPANDDNKDDTSSSLLKLNIVLQEDLTIRGGAQLWLMNCGARLQAIGHQVTFVLPTTSLLLEDLPAIAGASVKTYDADAIAKDPDSFVAWFTDILRPAQVCVTLVRQQRGQFQNVGFVARCISEAKLRTHLIAKTGTPDASYRKSFYGALLGKQASVITIAQYTKDFIVKNIGVPAELITNVYNGTDTSKFQRTADMAVEAQKRYPCVQGAYVVGCIGSFEARKAHPVLLRAAKKLITDGRLPNIYCLFVGEGPDKQMLLGMIEELGLQKNAALYDFTKQPFYVFERCNLVALPSTGKEGLPNVLLEALAMEKPCVATRAYGMPEVVLDGQTGYCFPSGDVDALADAIMKIAGLSDAKQKEMAKRGKEMIFAEHDKAKQFEKILEIIKEKAAAVKRSVV
eukprot:CAMPEP_0202714406 /NCGR_PEP_ID=MMETSP1385-20130828/72028_1 /ASSEMBLY_ACC=CAM_ASM_000861 /TAXON_ID=933848 /ORGANISM="Elphidium margaritaceum" /LENGTH=408 /DNA_ID=CAMNT_0049375197 /DNA_START=30 /DNA_END=1256 /DNA_ORIENTATION=+